MPYKLISQKREIDEKKWKQAIEEAQRIVQDYTELGEYYHATMDGIIDGHLYPDQEHYYHVMVDYVAHDIYRLAMSGKPAGKWYTEGIMRSDAFEESLKKDAQEWWLTQRAYDPKFQHVTYAGRQFTKQHTHWQMQKKERAEAETKKQKELKRKWDEWSKDERNKGVDPFAHKKAEKRRKTQGIQEVPAWYTDDWGASSDWDLLPENTPAPSQYSTPRKPIQSRPPLS